MKTYDLYYVDENGKKHYFDGISDMEVISSEKASLLRDKILGTNNKDGDENIFNLKGDFEIYKEFHPYNTPTREEVQHFLSITRGYNHKYLNIRLLMIIIK